MLHKKIKVNSQILTNCPAPLLSNLLFDTDFVQKKLASK